MNEQPMQDPRPVNPRRKKKTKMDVFQEVYLPFLIVAVSVFVIVGIIVSIASGKKSPNDPGNTSGSAYRVQQVEQLLLRADELIAAYDYDGALGVLTSFDGDPKDFPKLQEAINNCTYALNNMVTWQASQVQNLSFHVLVADLPAALEDRTHGLQGSNLYNRNFISTDEFTQILQQLYQNGYVLVDLSDLYTYGSEEGTFAEKQLQLPAGKTPILLTETHCSYYSYMESSHGFANKLLYDGNFYNEMVKADGTVVTGSLDLVPLLEDFIRLHPDFSYKGARAILAVSGYDGFFGYRITSDTLSKDALLQEKEQASALAQSLRQAGYTLACYSYNNVDYSVKSVQEVKEDSQLWQEKIASVIGQTDILVFARESDIGTSYAQNDKFDVLYGSGFRYFLGSSSILYQETGDGYVRHTRLMVTGSNLCHHANWFQNILNTTSILESCRKNIPQ